MEIVQLPVDYRLSKQATAESGRGWQTRLTRWDATERDEVPFEEVTQQA